MGVGGGTGGLSTKVPLKYRKIVNAVSQQTGLPVSVIAAQIDDESGWNPTAESPAGAEGIAQFMPGTWASWGKGSPDNPTDAFHAYGRYMGSLLSKYNGNLRDALAAYNAGPGNIQAGYGYADTILGAAGVPQNANEHQFYRNPFRHATSLTPERVDAGVDYSGAGPIYALGPGVITNVYNSGWQPGGAFIAEKLTKGPLAGHYVYVAEEVTPASGLHVGQHVTADTKIADFSGGVRGTMSQIETGFAAPPGTGNPLGQFDQVHPTKVGLAYSKILHELGAPPGTSGGPGTGNLPGWLKGLGGIFEWQTDAIQGGISNAEALGKIGLATSSIAASVQTFEQAVSWFLMPSNWVRVICFFAGGTFVILGIVTMSRTGKAYSVDNPLSGGVITRVPAPGGEIAPAIGIAEVTIGAILLFFAFHNTQAMGISTFQDLLAYIKDRVHGQAVPAS